SLGLPKKVLLVASVVVPCLSVPCAGAWVIVKLSAEATVSRSEPESCTVVGAASSLIELRPVRLAGVAEVVGWSLTGLTVIEIVLVALDLAASQLVLGAPQLSGSPRSVTL